jgi:hypothetical protein
MTLMPGESASLEAWLPDLISDPDVFAAVERGESKVEFKHGPTRSDGDDQFHVEVRMFIDRKPYAEFRLTWTGHSGRLRSSRPT